MARNGLFADDGRVTELALAIGRKLGEAINRISGLDAKAVELANTDTDHAALLNSLDLITKALKATDVDLSTLIDGKADISSVSALVAKFATYYNMNQIDDMFDSRDNMIDLISRQIMAATMASEPRYGKLAQTSLFFRLTTAEQYLPLSRDITIGGFQYDTSLGRGCLIVPEDGYYSINVVVLFSGGVGHCLGGAKIMQPASGTAYGSALVQGWKATGDDMILSRTEDAFLPKFTKVASFGRLTGDAVIASWGDSQMLGSTLSVRKI